jgi:hypothetical protein
MRSLFAAVLFAATTASFHAANAGGCGPGCFVAPNGGCVVNGWGATATSIGPVRNECPAGVRPRPPCPFGFVWRYGTCFSS